MQRKSRMATAFVLMIALVAGLSTRTFAAELIMFEDPYCPWCKLWDREIGPIYPKTDEGKRAPLKRIKFARDMRLAFSLAEPVVATPTFVLLQDGKEVGRLTGYKNAESFWGLLGMLLQKLPNSG